MKNQTYIIALLSLILIGSHTICQAQLLKGFGKKLEQKIENRLKRKVDQQVDNTLDKVDKKTDESLDKILNVSQNNDTDLSTSTNPTENQSEFEEVTPKPHLSMVLVGNSCDDFSWFKKGTKLEYEILDKDGQLEAESRTEVHNLSNKGSTTIADAETFISTPYSGDQKYHTNYICDADKIYMDLSPLMQTIAKNASDLNSQQKEGQTSINTEINYEKNYLSFPKNMYVGMKLDDFLLSFSLKSGSTEMTFQTEFTNRQVISKEEVTTKAGSFECLKIRSASNSSVKGMGLNTTIRSSVQYYWIAPNLGIIKQETYTYNKITSSMQLKAYHI